MTDRELLELAAKAAGIEIKMVIGDTFWRPDGIPWNPLDDDSDALRLAAKLRIDVDWQSTNDFRPTPHVEAYVKTAGPHFCALEHEDDYRLAIVRVAAEIGKAG